MLKAQNLLSVVCMIRTTGNMYDVLFATVFDPDVEASKEHSEIFGTYKKLVSAFSHFLLVY